LGESPAVAAIGSHLGLADSGKRQLSRRAALRGGKSKEFILKGLQYHLDVQ
jgi:hypothetical protein